MAAPARPVQTRAGDRSASRRVRFRPLRGDLEHSYVFGRVDALARNPRGTAVAGLRRRSRGTDLVLWEPGRGVRTFFQVPLVAAPEIHFLGPRLLVACRPRDGQDPRWHGCVLDPVTHKVVWRLVPRVSTSFVTRVMSARTEGGRPHPPTRSGRRAMLLLASDPPAVVDSRTGRVLAASESHLASDPLDPGLASPQARGLHFATADACVTGSGLAVEWRRIYQVRKRRFGPPRAYQRLRVVRVLGGGGQPVRLRLLSTVALSGRDRPLLACGPGGLVARGLGGTGVRVGALSVEGEYALGHDVSCPSGTGPMSAAFLRPGGRTLLLVACGPLAERDAHRRARAGRSGTSRLLAWDVAAARLVAETRLPAPPLAMRSGLFGLLGDRLVLVALEDGVVALWLQ